MDADNLILLDSGTERRLVQMAEHTVRRVHAGADPTEAVLHTLKQSGRNFPTPMLVKRLCQAVNAGLQVHNSAHKSADMEFDLINPSQVVRQLFVDDPELVDDDDLDGSTSEEKKQAQFEPPAPGVYVRRPYDLLPLAPAERKAADYRPIAGLFKHLWRSMRQLEKEASDADIAFTLAGRRLSAGLTKLAATLMHNLPLLPVLDQFAERLTEEPKIGRRLFEHMWTAKWSKLAGAHRAATKLAAERTPFISNQITPTLRTEFRELERLAVETARLRDQSLAADQKVASARRSIDVMVARVTGRPDPSVELCPEDEILQSITKRAEGDGGIVDTFRRTMKSVLGGEEDKTTDMMAMLNDPRQQAEIQAIDNLMALHDVVLGDEVLSQHDPHQVIDLYNEVVQLVPQLADQPAVLRGVLRKAVNQGGVMEPFELKQLIDIQDKKVQSDPDSVRQQLAIKDMFSHNNAG